MLVCGKNNIDNLYIQDLTDNKVEEITQEELDNLSKIVDIRRLGDRVDKYLSKCKLLGVEPEWGS